MLFEVVGLRSTTVLILRGGSTTQCITHDKQVEKLKQSEIFYLSPPNLSANFIINIFFLFMLLAISVRNAKKDYYVGYPIFTKFNRQLDELVYTQW